MTAETDLPTEGAPEITSGGVTDIIAKLAPFTFDSGLTVTMCAKFPQFGEKVTFSLEFTDEAQSETDASQFLAAVHANGDLLAARLAKARISARGTGLESVVSLEGIDMDPTWPLLILSAGPYNPDTEDEDDR